MCVLSFIGIALGRATGAQEPPVGPGAPTGEARAEDSQLPAESDLTRRATRSVPRPGPRRSASTRRSPWPSSATSACSRPATTWPPPGTGRTAAAASSTRRSRRAMRARPTTSVRPGSLPAVPWSGAPGRVSELPLVHPWGLPTTRASDLRVTLSQPLLRGFGPTPRTSTSRTAARGCRTRSGRYELSRQRLAVDVTGAFYQIVKQRELLRGLAPEPEAVARAARGVRGPDEGRAGQQAGRVQGRAPGVADPGRPWCSRGRPRDGPRRLPAASRPRAGGPRRAGGRAALPVDRSGWSSSPSTSWSCRRPSTTRLELGRSGTRWTMPGGPLPRAPEPAAAARRQPRVPADWLRPPFGDSFEPGGPAPGLRPHHLVPLERSGDKADERHCSARPRGRERDLRQAELDVDADVRSATALLGAHPQERRAPEERRGVRSRSSIAWRRCAISAASPPTSTWSMPRAAWSRPEPPSWACSRTIGSRGCSCCACSGHSTWKPGVPTMTMGSGRWRERPARVRALLRERAGPGGRGQAG